MHFSQAAFELDMRETSRIYLVTPVLKPQTDARATRRSCRINQKKPVVSETLILRTKNLLLARYSTLRLKPKPSDG